MEVSFLGSTPGKRPCNVLYWSFKSSIRSFADSLGLLSSESSSLPSVLDELDEVGFGALGAIDGALIIAG